ncbi:MAG: glycoside hydrolase family 88 protein [Cyclobacteriaceae bacterium]
MIKAFTTNTSIVIHRIALVGLLALIAPFLAVAQSPEDVLSTTRKVADKIIRETAFEYRNEVLTSNYWSQFQTLVPDNAASIAKGSILADAAGRLRMGLAFKGSITVFVNGEEAFSGQSDAVELLEYNYNMFRSQEDFEVDLDKGANDIIVLCEGGEVNVMMLPLNEKDERDNSASFVDLVTEPFDSHWLVSGPYIDASPNELLKLGQAKNDLNYTQKGQAWRVPTFPIARQLVVPEEASFQRHPYSEWHYANGGTMLGILNLYSVTDDDKYFEFVNRFADHVKDNMDKDRWQFENIPALRAAQYRLFRLTMLDDSGGPAIPFVELRRTYDVDKYNSILEDVLEHVTKRQDRLEDNTLCRSEPEANTIWGDDLFMSTPFLLRMALATGNDALFDDVAHQIIQFNKYLMNPETGLYFHGYYADRGEPAPFQWGRANGWVTWAMSEALMLMPKKHKDYKKILKIYRNHLASLVKYQEESGIWHQILNDPSTYEETSCTAMYTLSMARGINNGWLDADYRENVLAGWNAVTNKIDEDGTVNRICRGTGIGTSVAFYNERKTFPHDPRGLGAVLTAGSEVYKMLTED